MAPPINEDDRAIGQPVHPARSPSRKVMYLTTVIGSAVAMAWLLGLPRLGEVHHQSPALDVVLIIAFILSERLVVHLEVDREAHTFALGEVPLAVGLFFVSPAALLLCRLVGELIALGLIERQRPLKLLFNLALFALECTVALLVFWATPVSHSLDAPQSWVVGIAAVLCADLISILAVSIVIGWHGGEARRGRLALFGIICAVANSCLALTGCILLRVQPASLVLLVGLGTVVFVCYRGYARLAERYGSLALLYGFTSSVASASRPDELAPAILRRTAELMRAERAELLLFGEEEGGVGALHVRCDPDGAVASSVLSKADLELARAAIRRAEAPHGTSDDHALRTLQPLFGSADFIAASIGPGEGSIGILAVVDRVTDVKTFDAQDLTLFGTIVNHASVALDRVSLIGRLVEEAEHRAYQASHDALTGLANRSLLADRAQEHMDRNEPFVVMLMDLNRFKEVNDTLGHHTGDQLLELVAKRLQAAMPKDALVARFGGDEFSVVTRAASKDEGYDRAERVVKAFGEPFVVEGVTFDMTASIGLALYPEHGDDVQTLLRRADVAMYCGKGASNLEMYDPERDSHTKRRLSLAHDLRSSLANGDIRVFYQPKCRLSDGTVVGVEALVRWFHPVHGMVSPDEFIPIAEQSSLINQLTYQVLDDALTALFGWRSQGHNLTVAVNLAVRTLLDPDLPGEVARALSSHGLRPEHLTLEITESGVMHEPGRAVSVVQRLAAQGVGVSVDDFGTGYSSMSYLHRLPATEVKIDKSFVLALRSQPRQESIVRSIITLGHNLGLTVVAEGVEDADVWNQLRELGCDLAQGYLLSQPIDRGAMSAWLTSRSVVAAG